MSSLIADILADPEARSLEFGRDSLLSLPVPTAVKTGTSNDYRDAWAAGFSRRYTVAVWMGNLDRRPMREVTGSLGPALVLRAVFAELHRHDAGGPLYLSRKLRRHEVCRVTGRLPGAACPRATEWFRDGEAPVEPCPLNGPDGAVAARLAAPPGPPRLASPTPGLHLAMDPRIPDELEVFELRLEGAGAAQETDWIVDGELVASGPPGLSHLWHLSPGRHRVRARVRTAGVDRPLETEEIGFVVK